MKINWKITTYCPADCLCCQERLPNLEQHISTDEEINRIVRKIVSIYQNVKDSENYLSITGGEPTLVHGLDQYVNELSNMNVFVGIDTNGWDINLNWLNKMEKAGLKYILLSVYSLKEKQFNYLRGSENGELYKRVINTLKILKRYKWEGGKIQIRLQMVLFKQNYLEIPELLNFALNSKFEALSTSYYVARKPNKNILMSKNDIDKFKNEIVPQVIFEIRKYQTGIKLENNEKRLKSFFMFEKKGIDEIACGIYRDKQKNCNERNKMVIYPNGDIVPCLGFDYYMEKEYIYNIFYDNLKEEIIYKFNEFWNQKHLMCNSCANGYHVWIEL